MQLFLVEKCLKCRSERFQTQVATLTDHGERRQYFVSNAR
jgi:hypothetical protein